jgi:hypothetical protein
LITILQQMCSEITELLSDMLQLFLEDKTDKFIMFRPLTISGCLDGEKIL